MTQNVGAGGEHVGGRQHAGVLLDDRCGGGGGDGVEVALHRGPGFSPYFMKYGVGSRVSIAS